MKYSYFLLLILLSLSYSEESLDIQRNSLFDKKIKLPDHKSPVLLSFFTKGNQHEMNLWIESLNLGLIKRANVKLLNIISPGGMFFMIPKKKAFDKMKRVVKQEFEESVSYLAPKDRLAVLDLDIAWLGDYKRQLFNKFKAETNQSTVILFDPYGKQITRVDGYSKTKAAKLKLEVLKTLKNYDRFENKRKFIQNN